MLRSLDGLRRARRFGALLRSRTQFTRRHHAAGFDARRRFARSGGRRDGRQHACGAPALSVFLRQHGIGGVQYASGAVFAAIGAACLFALPKRYDLRTSVRRATVVVRAQWLPACFFALASTLQGGVNGALAVLTFQERGIVNGAAIFTATALTAFALRYPAGRLVDRFGARAVPTTSRSPAVRRSVRWWRPSQRSRARGIRSRCRLRARATRRVAVRLALARSRREEAPGARRRAGRLSLGRRRSTR